ncbi:MAG TPA: hypothetical protein VGS08_04440 [Candidatus Saccharimonadales bacterium]|nr:hypothetical protein [Candidatus Saccharimonadales bacterium]
MDLDLTAPQPVILKAIAEHIKRLTSNSESARRLQTTLQQALSIARKRRISKSSNLLSEFGSDGTAAIVNEVLQFMNRQMSVSDPPLKVAAT